MYVLEVYSVWGFLSLMNQYVYAFCQVFQVSSHYFRTCVCTTLFLFFWDGGKQICSIVLQITEALPIFSPIFFSSLLLRLDTFYFYLYSISIYIQIHSVSHPIWAHPMSFIFIFITVIVFFSFEISSWFIFESSLCLLTCLSFHLFHEYLPFLLGAFYNSCLKSFSDNSNIYVILELMSVDYLCQSELRLSWFFIEHVILNCVLGILNIVLLCAESHMNPMENVNIFCFMRHSTWLDSGCKFLPAFYGLWLQCQLYCQSILKSPWLTQFYKPF